MKVLIDDTDNAPVHMTSASMAKANAFVLPDSSYACTIHPCHSVVFHTGLAFEIPEGFVMKMHVRSSVGIKRKLILSNGTGIIDSGYRGEVRIALTNTGHDPVIVCDGERMAQCEICRVEPVEIVETYRLSGSERGTDGIGSTGK